MNNNTSIKIGFLIFKAFRLPSGSYIDLLDKIDFLLNPVLNFYTFNYVLYSALLFRSTTYP